MIVNTLVLASVFTMCGEFTECAFHEWAHGLVLWMFMPPGSTVIVTVTGGFMSCMGCSDYLTIDQNLLVTAAGPLGSLALMNVIIFIVLRYVKKERLLVRFYLWGFVCRSVTVSTMYFLGTFIRRGDTYYMAQYLGVMWGTSPLDIGIAFTIIGAISTAAYIFLIYRGARADLTAYYSDLLGTSGQRHKMVLGLTFVGAAFLTLANGLGGHIWAVLRSNMSLFYNGTIVAPEILEGIVILGLFGAIFLCSTVFSARLEGNFHMDNLKVIVMLLLIIMFFTLFPYVTVVK